MSKLWFVFNEEEAARLDAERKKREYLQFVRGRIQGLYSRLVSGDYSQDDVEDLGDFLEKIRKQDFEEKYFVLAEGEYRVAVKNRK